MKNRSQLWSTFLPVFAGTFLVASVAFAEDNTTNFLYNDGLLHAVVGDVTVGSTGTNNYGEVSNGSILNNIGNGQISHGGAAMHNLAVVSGTGSAWNPSGYMFVGVFGSDAQLIITNGGSVSSPSGGYIGYYYSWVTNNSVIVTGTGSHWSMGGALYIGANGSDNQLIISDGATVTNTGSTGIGSGNTPPNFVSSNNYVLVTGAGSKFVTTGSDFGLGGGGGNTHIIANGGYHESINFRGFAGNDSPNQILITNGGFAKTIGLSFGESAFNGGNLIQISGAGSVYTNTSNAIIGQSSSNNSVIVENGGKFYTKGVQTFVGGYFGSAGAFNNVTVTGTDSLWDTTSVNTNTLYFGYAGAGNTLTISDGGRVNADYFYNSTSSNTITVAGNGSRLDVGYVLYPNFGGIGNKLVVTNGGTVVTPATTLSYGGQNGQVIVTGSGSVYSNTGAFGVSVYPFSGTNSIVTENGGLLYAGSMSIGNLGADANQIISRNGGRINIATDLGIGNSVNNRGLVSDTGSVWDVGSTLFVGNLYGNNQLVITNGGVVKSAQALVGNYGAFYGYSSTNNSVIVTGPGSVWSNTTYYLGIGWVGSDNQLRIENGGKVYNTAVSYPTIIGGYYSASNNYVSVAGAGSLLSTPNQEMHVGYYLGANSNRLVVADGGRVDVGATLFVGTYSQNNYVTVTNGGQVFSIQGLIGYLGPSGGAYGHYNTVHVTGSGSVWSNSHAANYPIYVGYQGSSNQLIISDGGKVYTPYTHLSFTTQSTNNTVLITGEGSLLQNSIAIHAGNTGTSSGQDGRVLVTDGGILDTPAMYSGVGGSGSISNRGGVYQFPTATPTVSPGTAGQIAISNGTISYRGVASADIFNAQVGNMSKTGNNTFQLNASSNAAGLASYTFDSVANTGNPTNYQRLALVNGTTRWATTSGTTIGSGGALLISNTTATIAGALTSSGDIQIKNSKVTYGGAVTLAGTSSYNSDPSTNTFGGDVTVGISATMSGGAGDLFDFQKSFYIHATNRIGFNLANSGVAFTTGGLHTNAITGRDLGSNAVAWEAAYNYETNFAYGELHLGSGLDQICFETGDSALSNALYIGWLDLSSTGLVANLIAPSSINLYYDGTDTRNAYLGGLTYQLNNHLGGAGGLLLPVVPEPSALVLAAASIAAFVLRRRLRSPER